jgi:transposase-like protein
VTDDKRRSSKYPESKKREVLETLAASGGNIAATSRECGIRAETIRQWRNAARLAADSAVGPAPAGDAAVEANAGDLKRFTKDSWEIIHKANEVVRDKVDELGAKDAASIASGYFDRQGKAEEQMESHGETSEEYAAQWSSEAR